MEGLEAFVVRAKAHCYVGGGAARSPCRPGSHDIAFAEGDWSYLDSYFGGTDFLGQEVAWYRGDPVWAMNYYGRILNEQRIDAAIAGAIIKESLSALYKEGRFLGGFERACAGGMYVDRSDGDVSSFTGIETILINDEEVYRLDYCGGLIKA